MEKILNLYEIVYKKFPKEYQCHLKFVLEVAENLQRELGGDLEVISVAAIAHDFGRLEDGNNDNHPRIGSEIIKPILENLGFDAEKIQKIQECIAYQKGEKFKNIEVEIVYNADVASKILQHEAFMLMVKKDTFESRAQWALKYLDRIEKITIPTLKARCQKKYSELKIIYEKTLDLPNFKHAEKHIS